MGAAGQLGLSLGEDGEGQQMQRFAWSQGAVDDAAVPTSALEVRSFRLSEVSVVSPVTLKWLAMSG